MTELRISIEEFTDGTRTAHHSTTIMGGAPDALIVLRAAADAAAAGSTRLPAATRARGSKKLGLSEDSPTGGAPTLDHGPPAAPASPAASLKSPWARLVERLMADGELFEAFADQPPEAVLHNPQVQQAVRLLDVSGCTDSLRLVLRFGPTRCSQVRNWAEKIRRTQGTRSTSALIARVLEQGEPRGSQVRRSA